jgi:hypothetical protein
MTYTEIAKREAVPSVRVASQPSGADGHRGHIYRKPNTSKPAPGHRIYPYLLRNLTITRIPIRPGPWTSAIAPWRVASSIWPR